MPIYEFRCRSCEVVFEKLVRNSSQPVTCRHCGSEDLQKLISAHAIGTGAP